MLSEEEKREMLEMSRSAELRSEFARLRKGSNLPPGRPTDLQALLGFLGFYSRLAPDLPPRPPKDYLKALL